MAITLKLSLIEKLVGSRFMRKRVIGSGISSYIPRLPAIRAEFDINQISVFSVTVDTGIINLSHYAIAIFSQFAGLKRPSLNSRKSNRNTKIDLNFADRITKILEIKFSVSPRVHNNDVAAASKNHLIQTKVFEMSTI